MRIPSATYRIQFNPNYGFNAAKHIIPYLAELGISDLYASPITQPRQGSTHGYDVVDYNQLNPELGTETEFEQLIDELQDKNLGWLQDIVPNHMAYCSQNQFLMDVLEYGTDSEYFNYFDIDWEHPYTDIKGKVLTPLLGDFYGNCLERGEIQLKYDQYGFSVNYYSLRIPLKIESYSRLLTYDLGRLSKVLGREHPDFIKFLGILYILRNIPTEISGKRKKDQVLFVKSLIWELYHQKPEIKFFVDENINIFNGEVGKCESFNMLDNLLGEQFFRLSFWKVGAEELNYRRFFTINELICVKTEDNKVFQNNHELILKLIEAGKITGLRIDHIDGLYNPQQYLERLTEKAGDTYIVVEKIIELEKLYYSRYEELPTNWQIQGTSGYDFLACVNSLFCCSQGENYRVFSDIYANFTGNYQDYEKLVPEKKRLIAETNLVGDVENLANLFKKVAGKYRYGRDFTLNGLRRAISEVLVLFPVYRTYINSAEIRDTDRAYIQDVIEKAKNNLPQLTNELSFLEKILLLEGEETQKESEKEQWLHLIMKFQQVSGPLMAKGVEDTTMYVYNRLISLNEVGGTPNIFGIPISVFHNFNQKRQDHWMNSMNATSTHDTKRSEDVRGRINVISELPTEWEQQIQTWQELNREHKTIRKGKAIPDANDEYFFYQTLIGAFPFFDYEYPEFVERIKTYVVKAVREAKVHTAWLRPDSDYEQGFVDFVAKVLEPSETNQFLINFRPFQAKIAFYGVFNSLSQTLLKISCPGVPDFYQGSEIWDLSLVDPDNRRPVDFDQRWSWLADIKQREKTDIFGLINDLITNSQDGRLKLFLIIRALAARQQNIDLFQQAAYIPLNVIGKYQDQIIAFGRHYRQQTAITIVPRYLTNLVQPGTFPLGEELWLDTRVEIPQGLQADWKDSITDQEIANSDVLSVGQVLQHFPVALLISEKRNENP